MEEPYPANLPFDVEKNGCYNVDPSLIKSASADTDRKNFRLNYLGSSSAPAAEGRFGSLTSEERNNLTMSELDMVIETVNFFL